MRKALPKLPKHRRGMKNPPLKKEFSREEVIEDTINFLEKEFPKIKSEHFSFNDYLKTYNKDVILLNKLKSAKSDDEQDEALKAIMTELMILSSINSGFSQMCKRASLDACIHLQSLICYSKIPFTCFRTCHYIKQVFGLKSLMKKINDELEAKVDAERLRKSLDKK